MQPLIVNRLVVPLSQKLPKPPQFRPRNPSANFFHAHADLSTAARSLCAIDLGGSLDMNAVNATAGLTTVLYAGVGAAWVKDAYKQYKIAKKVGDTTGQRLAVASGLRAAGIGISSAATMPLRAISVYEMVGKIENGNFTSSMAVQNAVDILGKIANAFFGLYYLITAGRAGYDIYKKSSLKNELNAAPSAVAALQGKIYIDLRELEETTNRELRELAYDAGANWLKKVRKEWEKAGLKGAEISSEDERKKIIRTLFLENPEVLKQTLGEKARGLEGDALLLAFGREVKRQRLIAKKEEELTRVIGTEVVAKLKSGELHRMDDVTAKAYLNQELNRGLRESVGILTIGLIDFTIAVLGWVFTGGILNVVTAIGYTISSILWLACGDVKALYQQWVNGGVGKYDRLIIYLSSVLALLVIGLAITFTGGTILIPLVVFGIVWLAINARALYRLKRFEKAPWEFENIVKPESFHRLIQSGNEKEIRTYFSKMALHDQRRVQQFFAERGNLHEASTLYQKELAATHKDSLRHYRRIILAAKDRLAS